MLTGMTLPAVALLGALGLLLCGLLAGLLLYRQAEAGETERLAQQALERARVAQQLLGDIVELHHTVRDEFVRRWPDYRDDASARRFERLLEKDDQGAWRSRTEISDGRLHPTAWVRAGVVLSDELRQRVVLFHDLCSRWGPGATTRDDNLFFVGFPEQSNVGYDPFLYPNWSNEVAADYDQFEAQWGRLAYRPAEPGAATLWSNPEADESGADPGPVFAALTPIHVGERRVGTVGSMVRMKGFVERVLPRAGPHGGGAAIHVDDGRPLASFAAASAPDTGASSPLRASLAGLMAFRPDSATGFSTSEDTLYALARIDGPDWYVVTTLPGAELRARAAKPVLAALTIGSGVLLLALGLAALRLRAAEPTGTRLAAVPDQGIEA